MKKLGEDVFDIFIEEDSYIPISGVSDYFSLLKNSEKIVSYICTCGNDRVQRLLKYNPKNVYRCCNCSKKIEVKQEDLFGEEKI